MDFALILVIATFLTGLVWALDRLYLRGQRAQGADEPTVVEWCRAFFPVLLIVLLLRSFVAEPFRIPSASMMPTLLTGDFILVNKFSYGLRLPVLETRFLEVGTPRRGDVVVFRYPPEPSMDYIKRVVGVPGDHVAYRNKTLYINGEAVPQEFLGPYRNDGALPGSVKSRELVADKAYEILTVPSRNMNYGEIFDMAEGVTVPEGHFFMLGDNRDDSEDSRYWGFVPREALRGRPLFIYYSFDPTAQRPAPWLSSIRWNRLGRGVH
jgi:signal peptidase I